MRKVIYDIDINLQEYDIKACMQNDDINLIINIYENEKNYDLMGAKATLNWSKPDGTPLKKDMDINKNIVSITLNKDYTDIKGKAKLDIEIVKEGTVSTFPLCLVIVEKVFQSNKVNNKIVELLDIIKMDEYIDEFLDGIKKKQTELSSQIDENANLLNARMDTFTKLEEGSTTADAELKDIRVGANGTTYENAGNAVREQFNEIKTNLNDKASIIANIIYPYGTQFINGYVHTNGSLKIDTTDVYVPKIIISNDYLKSPKQIFSYNGYTFKIIKYLKANKKFISLSDSWLSNFNDFDNAKYLYKIEIKNNSFTEITPVDIKGSLLLIQDYALNTPKIDILDNAIQLSLNDGTSEIYTQFIYCNNSERFLVMMPDNIKCSLLDLKKRNVKARSKVLDIRNNFSVKTADADYFKLTFARIDGTDLQISNLTDEEKEGIKVIPFKSKNNSLYDVVIAPSDAEQVFKDKADIILDGINDTDVLQCFIGSFSSIRIMLYPGTINITKVHTNKFGKISAFSTVDVISSSFASEHNIIEINGYYNISSHNLVENATEFKVSQELHESLSDTKETAIFLVPNVQQEDDGIKVGVTDLIMNGIKIYNYSYNKPIVTIDGTFSRTFRAKNIAIKCQTLTGFSRFPVRPNEKYIGIRAGYGSCEGIQNYIKNCTVNHVGTGISVNGEHFILEDICVHTSLVGFAFGDKLTKGNYEHPNIMIGCSIEQCERLMTLSKYGATEESSSTVPHNTLICIGLSTEPTWFIPGDDNAGTSIMLPIKETIKGLYRGRLELDYLGISPFEEGSGTCMKFTSYGGTNGMLEG